MHTKVSTFYNTTELICSGGVMSVYSSIVHQTEQHLILKIYYIYAKKIKQHQYSKSHLCAKLGFNLLDKHDIWQQFNTATPLSSKKHT